MSTKPSKEAVELADAIVKRFNDYSGDTTEACQDIAQRALDKARTRALTEAANRCDDIPAGSHTWQVKNEILALRDQGTHT